MAEVVVRVGPDQSVAYEPQVLAKNVLMGLTSSGAGLLRPTGPNASTRVFSGDMPVPAGEYEIQLPILAGEPDIVCMIACGALRCSSAHLY
jgi:hypothetical protein